MLKENDFIEIDYVARIKDDGIFDLTREDVAKENNLYNPKTKYKPVIVCIGKGDVIMGLDKSLIGKETGSKYVVKISPEEGFGKKENGLIKLLPTKEFTKQNVKPILGMHLDMGGIMGKIISVTGGRTLVDFNNPLSGRDLVYEVDIKREVIDKKEKLIGFLDIALRDYKLDFDNDEATITGKIQPEIKKKLEKEIKERIKISKITFNE